MVFGPVFVALTHTVTVGWLLTLAIWAWTPLDFRAVTAFCAAAGLSKSTKPYPARESKHWLCCYHYSQSDAFYLEKQKTKNGGHISAFSTWRHCWLTWSKSWTQLVWASGRTPVLTNKRCLLHFLIRQSCKCLTGGFFFFYLKHIALHPPI